MIITFNGKPREIEPNSTLAQTLADENLPKGGVAVAINGKVVPRARWETCFLHEGDDLFILTAAYGG